MKKLVGVLALGTLVACGSENRKSIVANVIENRTEIFMIDGSAAESLYNALQVDGVRAGFGSIKNVVGVNLYCVKKLVAATSLYECSAEQLDASDPMFKMKPLFSIQGTTAEGLYQALRTPGKRRGFDSVKAVDGNVDIRCAVTVQGIVETHGCSAVASL